MLILVKNSNRVQKRKNSLYEKTSNSVNSENNFFIWASSQSSPKRQFNIMHRLVGKDLVHETRAKPLKASGKHLFCIELPTKL